MNFVGGVGVGVVPLVWLWLGTFQIIQANSDYGHSIFGKSGVLNAIFSDYDKSDRPLGKDNTPLVVEIAANILKIENLDDSKLELSIELLLIQQWEDERLRFHHIPRATGIQDELVLPASEEYRIWSPDTFFNNAKSGFIHSLIMPNRDTRILANGTVYQSFRLSLTLSCAMDLSFFPMDSQKCPVNIEVYSWHVGDVILKWREMDSATTPEFTSAKFRFKSVHRGSCNSTSASEEFSCLSLKVNFDRELSFYIIRTFVPCVMLVILSWLPFWLEPSAIEARLSLAVTIILAMVTQIYSINQSSPSTSYIKSVDVWTTVCQIMAFSSLLEAACTSYLVQKEKDDAKSGAVEESGATWCSQLTAKKIDIMARIIFPLVFLVFNCLFWGVHLSK